MTTLKANKNYMTPTGWKYLKNELYHIVHHERPKIVEIINWAASNGDRSENGDYIYSKRRLREIDKRIRYLTKRLEIAEVIDPELREKTEQVFFSATVTIRREDDSIQTISIVGTDEIDLQKGKISWISPLAKALIGNFSGDKVKLTTPEKEEYITIKNVQYIKIE
ncbi:MAG: transcription elongation factor GreB [Neisseriaceae bacterium]|nr:MAG: transcription elongation factor GreB [Neisseriaceae bacterium]